MRQAADGVHMTTFTNHRVSISRPLPTNPLTPPAPQKPTPQIQSSKQPTASWSSGMIVASGPSRVFYCLRSLVKEPVDGCNTPKCDRPRVRIAAEPGFLFGWRSHAPGGSVCCLLGIRVFFTWWGREGREGVGSGAARRGGVEWRRGGRGSRGCSRISSILCAASVFFGRRDRCKRASGEKGEAHHGATKVKGTGEEGGMNVLSASLSASNFLCRENGRRENASCSTDS